MAYKHILKHRYVREGGEVPQIGNYLHVASRSDGTGLDFWWWSEEEVADDSKVGP